MAADRLRRAVHLGTFAVGERLPPERDLAARLGVSRVTLREALSALEASGYIVRRRGAHGGPRVAEPDAAVVRAQLAARIGELDALAGFRCVIEGGAARLAAERAGATERTAVDAALDALHPGADPRAFRRADTRFHLAVARASGNPELAAAIVDARERLFSAGDAVPYEVRIETTLAGHRRVADAIAARDGAAAAAAMEAHIRAGHAELRAVLGLAP